MDYTNLSAEELKKLGIFELRNAAREIGVKSPTTYNKSDLVIEMQKVFNGEIAPAAKSKRGRPPKGYQAINEVDKAETQKEPMEKKIVIPIENSYKKTEEQSKPTRTYVANNNYSSSSNYRRTSAANSNNNYNRKPNTNKTFNKFDKNARKGNNMQFADQSREQFELDPNIIYEEREGVLEVLPDNYGFLRSNNCENSEKDSYIAAMKIRKFGLRPGDYVKGLVAATSDSQMPAIIDVKEVNGESPEQAFNRPKFDNLTPIFPDSRYRLEYADSAREYAIRSIDLIAPIGKGQRAMIVSPPKAGKTTLLKQIANSISINYPESELIVLLIGERPEEVTDMKRFIKGDVIFSTFDEMPDHHTKAAEMVLNKAKRLVESGRDVVLLLDSLTRLARAYNMTITPTGRSLSGGLDPGALHSPKRFFGAARNIENGGSLTIIATALVETGSRMDDVIFEEFKGTGNMEIHLDRKLSERRIFPAIDLAKSSTRREDLLLSQKELEGMLLVRRILSSGESSDSIEQILKIMQKTRNNDELIEQLNMQLAAYKKNGYVMRKNSN